MADHRVDPEAPAGGDGPGNVRVPRQPKLKGMHLRLSLLYR
jgi:hypothetical protein